VDYDDYLIMQEEQRWGPDCDCDADDHDLCVDEECECLAHEKNCESCKTKRGCRCDQIYDEWRDEQVWVVP